MKSSAMKDVCKPGSELVVVVVVLVPRAWESLAGYSHTAAQALCPPNDTFNLVPSRLLIAAKQLFLYKTLATQPRVFPCNCEPSFTLSTLSVIIAFLCLLRL